MTPRAKHMPFIARLTLSVVCLTAAATYAADPAQLPTGGVLPVGADGKPLNTDFETGDLRDWTMTGGAFNSQPVKGDTINARRKDMNSRHAGQYWVGTFEI